MKNDLTFRGIESAQDLRLARLDEPEFIMLLYGGIVLAGLLGFVAGNRIRRS
jgi:hypothetical protein